jgi:hypothetical protein
MTKGTLKQYDDLPAIEAAIKAWTNPGPSPYWHARMQDKVRGHMPLLARALDRLAEEARR